jgi:hypothetical protein
MDRAEFAMKGTTPGGLNDIQRNITPGVGPEDRPPGDRRPIHIDPLLLTVEFLEAVNPKVLQKPGPEEFCLPDDHRIGMG